MKRSGNSKKASLQSIAPRYQKLADTTASDPYAPSSVNLPRPRLPPRSRFGCWTCRTRKVKCDEARPECTPCSRLGHNCDYNPRLAFKDDTPRVIEKISGPSGGQGPAWQSTGSVKRQRLNALEDVLPPFASLSTDDDRETKAQFRLAGTYNVIVNPESFIGLYGYRETSPEDAFPQRRQPYAINMQEIRNITRPDSPVNSFDEFEEINDPDIVVLKVFEDDSLTSISPAHQVPRTARSSRTVTMPSISNFPQHPDDYFQFSLADTPLMRFAHPDGRDHSVIYYYKNFVYRHLGQVHRDSLGTPVETGALSAPDVFETQAGRFLPLYHALMAFSALSMSHNNCSPCVEALCHYQQALPLLQASLHTEEDLASDGVFLTHFILLLYEIAAGEARGLSLWNQHIWQLQRIILLRKQMYGNEPYTFILWWVASIDTHVVLSGMGDGSFCETMLRQNLLSTGIESETRYSPFTNKPVADLGALPSSLAFHRRIMVVAAELGLLTRDLREESRQLSPNQPSLDTIRQWQERISTLQDTLRRAWNVQMPASVASGYCNQLLPVGARGIFEHSFALYRALLIYSHTSMYPTQRLHNPSHTIHEVSRSAGEILRLGREIVSNGHTERKFVVFPLFMAGFANRSKSERDEILALIRNLEVDSIGRNGVAARQLLEIVYERQDKRTAELKRERKRKGLDAGAAAAIHGEGVEDVDWVGVIAELGLQVVNCRL